MPMVDLLWVAARSRNTNNAGTDNWHNITVNIDGEDVVDWNVTLSGPDAGLGRGQAALQNSRDLPTPFESLGLTNPSIRMGLRGDDAWAPQDVFIFGRTQPSFEPGRTIALGMETDITRWLSTDRGEGHLTMPIRLVSPGSSATVIRRALLLVYTYSGIDIETDDRIQLTISTGSTIVADQVIGDTPQDDLEQYTGNWYPIDVSVPFTRADVLANGNIRLRILGTDAWRPKTVFVFGLDTPSGRPNEVVTLVAIPEWDMGVLSADPGEGSESVLLPVQGI